MKKTMLAMSALLAVQLALAVGIPALHGNGAAHPKDRLFAFDAATVDGLTIEKPGSPPLTLRKRDGKWSVPSAADAPADGHHVDSFLATMTGLKGGWPVASTEQAAKRFKVSSDSFEYKVSLNTGDKPLGVLLIGSAPSYRATNVRLDGTSAIYTVALDAYEVNADAGEWEDRSLLNLTAADITSVALSDLTLTRTKDSLQPPNVGPGEQVATDKIASLERQLANPAYATILGTEAKPEYGLDKPAASVKVTLKDGKTLTYDYGKMASGDDYVLRVSGQKYLFQVPKYAASPIVEAKRDTIVTKKPAEAPKPPQGAAAKAPPANSHNPG